MSFTAILFALLLEQAWPLASGNSVHLFMRHWVQAALRYFDAGDKHHVWLAWSFATALPSAVVLGVHWLLIAVLGWWAAILWNVAVLYACVGFRQFSHHFTAIRDALEAGDEMQASRLLAEWRSLDVKPLPRNEVVRQVMEHSVIAAHRHVLGVFAWFSVLAVLGLGPTGAVFYRLCEFVPRYWRYQSLHKHQPVSEALLLLSERVWQVIDWLPARTTALGFAVVGSFEEAADSWRAYTLQMQSGVQNDGIILAASSGAINVQLGEAAMKPSVGEDGDSAAPPVNRQEPQMGHLRSVVGLVWRSVVLWMVLLALLSLARLLG